MAKSKMKTVLVIEDEAEIRNFACRVLELEGYHVLFAEDGTSGLELLNEITVDLVLLDLRLPVRNGWSLLAHLKSEPLLSKIPVIIFTASAGLPQHKRAFKLGATGYLVKPLSARSLRKAVANQLHPVRRDQHAIKKTVSNRRR